MKALRIAGRFSRIVCGLLAIHLGGLAGAARAADPDPFAQWPESWANAYRRFERFSADRDKFMPSGKLEISPRGEITYQEEIATEWDKNAVLDFYRDGDNFLGSGKTSALFSDGRSRRFPPAKYAVRLHVAKPGNIQNLYPLTWFETYRDPRARERGETNGEPLIRHIPAPEPAEDFWPYERLLKFIDFTRWKSSSPAPKDVIQKILSPSIAFTLGPTGVLTREKLDEPLEKLLHWRIYRDGRLIERGPAADVIRFPIEWGPGVYQVFVGVEGPGGFMPVSQPLQFPLFPEKNGGLAVFPSMTNPTGFPDFLVDVLPPEVMEELLALKHSPKARPTFYNVFSFAYMSAIDPLEDEKKDSLRRLWGTWGWSLNTYHQTGVLPPNGTNLGF